MEPFPPGRRRRRGTFVPVSRVPLPPGAPAGLLHVLRRARLREALGPELGPLLRDWHRRGDEVVLVLADSSRFARLVAGMGSELRAAVSRALGREIARVVVRSAPIDSTGEER